MWFNDIRKLCDCMNTCSEKGIPFLFLVNFEKTEGYFIEHPLNQKEILFQTPLGGNKLLPADLKRGRPYGDIRMHPLSPDHYESRFRIVQEGLHRGDSYVTNLTVRTPVDIPCTLEDIFLRSNSSYQVLVPGHFVCFSPEQFIRIQGNTIATCPMKGTCEAAGPQALQSLLEDFKETAEHSTVVDLLRNDLSRVARNVQVKRFRYVDRVQARG